MIRPLPPPLRGGPGDAAFQLQILVSMNRRTTRLVGTGYVHQTTTSCVPFVLHPLQLYAPVSTTCSVTWQKNTFPPPSMENILIIFLIKMMMAGSGSSAAFQIVIKSFLTKLPGSSILGQTTVSLCSAWPTRNWSRTRRKQPETTRRNGVEELAPRALGIEGLRPLALLAEELAHLTPGVGGLAHLIQGEGLPLPSLLTMMFLPAGRCLQFQLPLLREEAVTQRAGGVGRSRPPRRRCGSTTAPPSLGR